MAVEELRVLATATDMSEVGIIVGSETDMPVMDFCREVLVENHIEFDNVVASAHRSPHKVQQWTSDAESRGNKVIIAAAGMSAALPGVVAAYTRVPVIGVPMKSELNGLDSLLSISQMPKGVPVACMAVGSLGARNAALFAAQVLGIKHDDIREAFENYRKELQAR